MLTVQPFDSGDEAIEMADGTVYGLAAGLQPATSAAHTASPHGWRP